MPLFSSTKLDAVYLNFLRGELAQAQFSYAVKAEPPSTAAPVKPAADPPAKPKLYEGMLAMPALAAP